jgi:hypothetical protein
MSDLKVTRELSTKSTVTRSPGNGTFKQLAATPPGLSFCVLASRTLAVTFPLIARADVTDMAAWIQFQIYILSLEVACA